MSMDALSPPERRGANRLSQACRKRHLSWRSRKTIAGGYFIELRPKIGLGRQAAIGRPTHTAFGGTRRAAYESAWFLVRRRWPLRMGRPPSARGES